MRGPEVAAAAASPMTHPTPLAPPDGGALLPDPYAQIAAFYDAEFSGVSADALGYARRGVKGPLLVLGCGTGRICRALEDTRPVVGLDASEAMLARAHGRSRYVLGDMRAFDLGRFAEVVVPNGAFAFLPRRRDQAACLESIHRALSPGAPLTIDLPLPDFALLGTPHTPEKIAWEGLLGETPALRTREVFREPVGARLRLVDRYYLGGTFVTESRLDLRLVFPNELEWMLESAGFYVEALYGDHADSPLRDGRPRLLARAIRL